MRQRSEDLDANLNGKKRKCNKPFDPFCVEERICDGGTGEGANGTKLSE